jgi:mono/diheme cytochrome c family protein
MGSEVRQVSKGVSSWVSGEQAKNSPMNGAHSIAVRPFLAILYLQSLPRGRTDSSDPVAVFLQERIHALVANAHALAAVMILLPAALLSADEDTKFHNAPASAQAAKNPYAGQEEAAQAGKQLHTRDCLSCHGKLGHGTSNVPSLVDGKLGIAVNPQTGDLWCSVNERDALGDNLVPDYITHVREGGFYGWPWWYIGAHHDPRHQGKHPELKDKVIVPNVLLQHL